MIYIYLVLTLVIFVFLYFAFTKDTLPLYPASPASFRLKTCFPLYIGCTAHKYVLIHHLPQFLFVRLYIRLLT